MKKLIKFLLIIVAVLGISFFGFMFWVAIKIVSPAGTTNLEKEGSKVSLLVDCKEMLMAENAWNPSINYNYVYYFKSGRCPSSDKLQNVEQVQKEFCDRVAKEDPNLHNFYVNNIHGGHLCPSDKSDNNSTQQN